MTNLSPVGSPPSQSLLPSKDEILRFMGGVALMMTGRKDGLARLDCSPDGFWQSFSAILVALPAIALSWIEFESVERSGPAGDFGAAKIYAAHALADLIAWLLPVVLLLLVAKRIGYGRKVSPLVVSTNWAGALIAWAVAPYLLLAMAFGMSDAMIVLGAMISTATLVLVARLVHTVLGDWTAAIAATVLLMMTGLLSYGVVMDITGVPLI